MPLSSNNSPLGSWRAHSLSPLHPVCPGRRKLIPFWAWSSKLTLSVVVGAATPGVAKWILAILCYIGAGIQVLGFIAVSKVSKSPIHTYSAVCDRVFKRPSLRKNPSYSNDIYHLTGSSLSLGSRCPSFGSSYPQLDTPPPKLTARGITTLSTRLVTTPLHLRMHRIPSVTSSRGLTSGSWEVYGSSS